jgi:hypothetical protein
MSAVVVASIFGVYRRSALGRTSLHKPYFSSDYALLAEIVLLGRVVHVSHARLYNREHPERSVRLDSTARILWQDPNASGTNPLELSRRVWHLMEIIHRRRDVEPLYRTAPVLLAWACGPLVLGRLVLESIGTLSPSLRWRLRGLGLSTLAALENLTARPAAASCPDGLPIGAGAVGQQTDRDALEHLVEVRNRTKNSETRGRAKGH